MPSASDAFARTSHILSSHLHSAGHNNKGPGCETLARHESQILVSGYVCRRKLSLEANAGGSQIASVLLVNLLPRGFFFYLNQHEKKNQKELKN